MYDFYWIGAHDVGNNDIFVWVETGEVLPDDSEVWATVHHGNHDCVGVERIEEKLHDILCHQEDPYICQAVV